MSTVAKKEKMSVRHMLVVLTGIMITFGCSALCFSTWGLFQPVVAEGLGVETTAFAMYVTVMYLTMTVASPFMGKLLQTVDIRIILSVSACLVAASPRTAVWPRTVPPWLPARPRPSPPACPLRPP